MRALLIVALLTGGIVPAAARTIPCWQVRAYVGIYGEAAALAWAKEKGYSEATIRSARRCLARATNAGSSP